MSKVKITQEQANWLEKLIAEKSNGRTGVMNSHCDGGKWVDGAEPLNVLSADEMARALYIGYDIKPEFKCGDWVYWDDDTVGIYTPQPKGYEKHIAVRHATPEEIAKEKERRWWSSNGREVWELKQGDVLMGIHRALYEVTADPKSHRYGVYTGNDTHDFTIDECKRGNWKVICFNENRLDNVVSE